MTQSLSTYMPDGKHSYRADCTVVALALVTELPYTVVFDVLRQSGRRDNSGFAIDSWLRQHRYRVLGHHFHLTSRHDDEGKFLVWNNGHAAAIIEGKLVHRLDRGIRYKKCFFVTRALEPDGTGTALRAATARYALMADE